MKASRARWIMYVHSVWSYWSYWDTLLYTILSKLKWFGYSEWKSITPYSIPVKLSNLKFSRYFETVFSEKITQFWHQSGPSRLYDWLQATFMAPVWCYDNAGKYLLYSFQAFSILSKAKEEDDIKRQALLSFYAKAQDLLSRMDEPMLTLLQRHTKNVKETLERHEKQLKQTQYFLLVSGKWFIPRRQCSVY